MPVERPESTRRPTRRETTKLEYKQINLRLPEDSIENLAQLAKLLRQDERGLMLAFMRLRMSVDRILESQNQSSPPHILVSQHPISIDSPPIKLITGKTIPKSLFVHSEDLKHIVRRAATYHLKTRDYLAGAIVFGLEVMEKGKSQPLAPQVILLVIGRETFLFRYQQLDVLSHLNTEFGRP